MADYLSKAILCNNSTCLNITKHFQFYVCDKHNVDNDPCDTLNDTRIIMRVDINGDNEQMNSDQLLIDLNEAITYRDMNSLAFGNTTYLDASYGAHQTVNTLEKYWVFILVACILFLILFILIILYILKNQKNRYLLDLKKIFPVDFLNFLKKKFPNFLNVLSGYLFFLILIDLALDIAFITLHGYDYEWTLPVT